MSAPDSPGGCESFGLAVLAFPVLFVVSCGLCFGVFFLGTSSPSSAGSSSDDPYSGGQVPYDNYQGEESFACLLPPAIGYLTDRYGVPRGDYTHGGIDYGCYMLIGVPVRTPMGGKVVYTDLSPAGYGKLVVIENQGWQVYLGHNSSYAVAVGDLVSAGEIVAYTGNTGQSSGPHVHFEERKWNEQTQSFSPQNPLTSYLPGQTDFCDWYSLQVEQENEP